MSYSPADRVSQGRRLQELIDYLGVTNKEFSERIGYSQTSLSLIIRGSHGMSKRFVSSLSRVNANKLWLLKGEGNKLGDIPAHPESVITNRDVFRPKMSDETAEKYMQALQSGITITNSFAESCDEDEAIKLMREYVELKHKLAHVKASLLGMLSGE
jgi:hypothetical protein